MLFHFWNSPQQLTNLFRALTALILACPIALFFVNQRIDTLKSQKLAEQELELQSQRAEVDRQAGHVAQLTSEAQALRKEALALQMKAIDAERHVSDTYDFNGAHRQTSGGRIQVTVGQEVAAFQTMSKLQDARDWSGLIALCEKQILKTPTWLTPYLFAGVGYANVGESDKARERLQYVVERAGNDPQYSDASRILNELPAH